MEINRTKICPIFIIGAARNGTTQLGNTMTHFREVATVDHELHYGSCEATLYYLNKFWGKLDNVDGYIDFLYNFSSADFFKLAQGDIFYHLDNPKDNVYEFFFDLMDQHALKMNKPYWSTKIDPPFFTDDKERHLFLKLLNKRYPTVYYISIKRNLNDSLLSFINMEGKNYFKRQKASYLLPTLLLQIARYKNIYTLPEEISKGEILKINFEDFIRNKNAQIERIASFIGLNGYDNKINYQINTSFVKTKKDGFSKSITSYINIVSGLFSHFSYLSRKIERLTIKHRRSENPIYRRLLKIEYFKQDLIRELENRNSLGLLENLNNSSSPVVGHNAKVDKL